MGREKSPRLLLGEEYIILNISGYKINAKSPKSESASYLLPSSFLLKSNKARKSLIYQENKKRFRGKIFDQMKI
jgi:hypothetical protein